MSIITIMINCRDFTQGTSMMYKKNFINEILRINDELHLSQREIAKANSKSRNAVNNV